ncbi:hypothetical protein ACHAXR_011127 [Thalassiosira sp. AJA248-18]
MAATAQLAQGSGTGSNIATESEDYDYLMEYVAEVKAAAAASESEQNECDDTNFNDSVPHPKPPVALPTATSGTATRPRVMGSEADVVASLMTLKQSFSHSGAGSDGSEASSSNQLAGLKRKSDGEQDDWQEEKEEAEEEAYPANGSMVLHSIREPGINDCLFGRGGGTNHHPGNMRYRRMVAERRHIYKESTRSAKPEVAMEIVNAWRAFNGRFLMMDPTTKLWYDVGDDKARLKTSQTLREKEIFPTKKKKKKQKTEE